MKWEYLKLINPKYSKITQLGLDSWECYSVILTATTFENWVYFFKRPLEEKDGVELG